jgi:PAS domain S-box-containing protein
MKLGHGPPRAYMESKETSGLSRSEIEVDAGDVSGNRALTTGPPAHERLERQYEELSAMRVALEAERERFHELFQFAPFAYVVTDRRGVIRDLNVAAEELFKRPRDRLIRKPLRIFVPVERKDRFYEMMERLDRTGRIADVELTLSAPASLRVSISASVYPQTGMPIERIRWQFLDVTERVVREEEVRSLNAELEERVRERTVELTRANAAKDEFLGMISHELKTPITVIAGNAEALTRHGAALTPEQRDAALLDVRIEADRLQRIVDNLLVLARLEGGQDIGREPLRLDLLVKSRVQSHRARYPRRTIETTVDGPVLVDASPVYAEQVLRNLFSNAEKYSPAEGAISVSVDNNDRESVVTVEDHGAGVPEDEMKRLFTPFYRSKSTAAYAPGAGIGLAVCKRLVEAQGGHIWAERRDEGGMRFSFSLPRAEAEEDV